MKNIIIKLSLGAALIILTSQSLFAAGWTGKSKIDILNIYTYIVLVRVPADAFVNPDNCSLADNYYSLKLSHPLFKEAYSSLLAVKISKSQVKFNLSGCDGADGSGRPNISTVIIYD